MKEGGGGRCHVAVRVSDFEAAVAALQAQGVELEEPKIKPGSKAVFLVRPDRAGNRVHTVRRPQQRAVDKVHDRG